MQQGVQEFKSRARDYPLEKYGINLTRLAREGKIDLVIGREDEIPGLFKYYQEKKNNPVLIGEPERVRQP